MDDNDDVAIIDISGAGNEAEARKSKLFKATDTFKTLRYYRRDWELKKINEDTFRERVNKLLYEHPQNDTNELYFITAAKFLPKKLQEIINDLSNEDLNQLKLTDSALVFALKYGDVKSENFLKCVEILVNSGIDINKFDIRGKTAIEYIALLYENYGSNNNSEVLTNLKNAAKLLIDKGIIYTDDRKTNSFLEQEMRIDLSSYNFAKMDEQTKLFYWVVRNKTQEFLNFKNLKNIVNCDNGEDTILQFVSQKSDNMQPIVQCLLKNKADPNKVTKWNKLTPLQLAGFHNHQKIFADLLRNKSTKVDQEQFSYFVVHRSQPMKPKLFELLLESDKLDPNFIYAPSGNRPLHYAIMFSHKQAIQNLLKRESSLVEKNKIDKSCLDMIDQKDLETYFDSCLALDNYTPYFSDNNYKMKFRFSCLIDKIRFTEMHIISKIGKNSNLEHLLKHPFIHTFISLKWYKTKFYYKAALLSQALFFIFLSILFYRLPDSSVTEYIFCFLLSLLNCVVKIPIFLNFKWKKTGLDFFVLDQVRMHGAVEILLTITIVGSFFQNQFRAFVFTEMAISFLLTAGYHPKLSKWSLMLQKVFKTFTILLLFFSLIVLAFSAGFQILFKHDDKFFAHFSTAIFKTFMMSTGEFEVGDADFQSGFSGYLLFLLFAMSMSLVIVNFWTGVAVTDIERIEKDSEINAFKNVIIFMSFVDYIYNREYLRRLRKYVPKPLLFLCVKSDNSVIYHDPGKCEVDFFVNKSKQFETKEGFPEKIDSDCFNKIGLHYHKLKKITNEQKILAKLEVLEKLINEVKAAKANNANSKQNEAASPTQPSKSYSKKTKKN